jgi:hypothetical protein
MKNIIVGTSLALALSCSVNAQTSWNLVAGGAGQTFATWDGSIVNSIGGTNTGSVTITTGDTINGFSFVASSAVYTVSFGDSSHDLTVSYTGSPLENDLLVEVPYTDVGDVFNFSSAASVHSIGTPGIMEPVTGDLYAVGDAVTTWTTVSQTTSPPNHNNGLFNWTGFSSGDTFHFESGNSNTGGGHDRWDFFPRFQIAATVPEPSSTILLGLGGLGFLMNRKRK